MFGFLKKDGNVPLIFFNTLGKKKEEFTPLSDKEVRMYTCGITAYDVAHIGNLRAALFPDIIRRVLEWNEYKVKSVINITDFGHLATDDENSEDKMTKALKREGLSMNLDNMKKVAEKYARIFIDDLKELNAEDPEAFPRASEHITEQIAYIQTLLDKGYAYQTKDGIYFDVGKFSKYGELGGTASVEFSRVGINAEKHDPRDFSLWKDNPEVGWDSPWGKGFPGWHIECTAMATKYLGKSFDIHAGGVDLIPIHHNNEIAQAEAATGKQYVKYWLHNEFITIDSQKVSKSLGNTISLKQLRDRGIMPLALRYWFLTGHYRSLMNFTWEAIEGAQTAYLRAMRAFTDLPAHGGELIPEYSERFTRTINDDLNMPEAIAVMWELLKDEKVKKEDKRATLCAFDKVLGLGFDRSDEMLKVSVIAVSDIPEEIQKLVEEREVARKEKRFSDADMLRTQIKENGFDIEDSTDGPVIHRAS